VGLSAIQANERVIGASEVKRLKRRIRELERLLGKKTLAAGILKESIERYQLSPRSLSQWNVERGM
jgi:transposase